jgi:hypothetical protein
LQVICPSPSVSPWRIKTMVSILDSAAFDVFWDIATKGASNASVRTEVTMHVETLKDFYASELKDLYSVEKQLTSNWPGLQFIRQLPT